MAHTTLTLTASTAPILQGHHTIGTDTVPFVVHTNLSAETPARSFVGLAHYQGRIIITFANNAPDCKLGLQYLLLYATKRPPAKGRIPLDASVPEPPTLH